MGPNIDLVDVATSIMSDRDRIEKNMETIWRLAQERADAELVYKRAYAIKIEELRIEKYPATLIKELAEGQVAELRRSWELASGQYRAALASLEALQTNIQALQSILRHMEKV